jgi:predicted MFS family arabinose efflux permease
LRAAERLMESRLSQSLAALNALNFAVADVRDGLGPFLGVYLQQNAWSPSEIGFVMSLAGLAAMAATTPLGLLVDATRAKRLMLAVAIVSVTAASLLIWIVPEWWAVAGAQTVAAIAGAAIGPALAGVTLGLVGQAGFARQLGRNEAFNHAGNAAAAAASGVLGYAYGLGAVFALMAVLTVGAMVATALIRPGDIDHAAARGEAASHAPAESVWAMLRRPQLALLAATMALFHFGNAAMLPLLGQAMVGRGEGLDPSAFTAATVLVAQLTMIPVALLAASVAARRGYGVLFIVALLALPLRAMVAAWLPGGLALAPAQVLDGVGAGLLGVALPGMVARVLEGSGRVNAGLGAVMTAQGMGAALSAAFAGVIAHRYGYDAAFLALGGAATAGLALWVTLAPRLGMMTAQTAQRPAAP